MGWELVQKPPTRKGAEKLDCHPARRGPAAFGCYVNGDLHSAVCFTVTWGAC